MKRSLLLIIRYQSMTEREKTDFNRGDTNNEHLFKRGLGSTVSEQAHKKLRTDSQPGFTKQAGRGNLYMAKLVWRRTYGWRSVKLTDNPSESQTDRQTDRQCNGRLSDWLASWFHSFGKHIILLGGLMSGSLGWSTDHYLLACLIYWLTHGQSVLIDLSVICWLVDSLINKM